MESKGEKTCFNKALQILTRRDHSCAELSKKLRQRGFGQNEIQAAMSECKRLGYLNDQRFADIYVQQLERRGYGINGIKQKLYAKGLPREVIHSSLETCRSDTDQLSLCQRVLSKKIRHLETAPPLSGSRAKLHRFLLSRGFQRHIVNRALELTIVGKD